MKLLQKRCVLKNNLLTETHNKQNKNTSCKLSPTSIQREKENNLEKCKWDFSQPWNPKFVLQRHHFQSKLFTTSKPF